MPGYKNPRPTVAQMVGRLVVGGGTRTACIIAANLEHDKFRSILISGRRERDEREDSELVRRLQLKPLYIDAMRRSIGPSDLFALGRVQHLLNANQVRLVNTHSSKAGALGRLAGMFSMVRSGVRPRIVHTVHGHVFSGYFNAAASRLIVSIERFLARFTDTILTVSDELRRELVDRYRIAPSSKVRVMPLGLDFDWTREMPHHRGWLRERIGIDESTFLLGSIGRLVPVKDHALLLTAFQHARQRGLDAALVLFGDGELRDELKRQCQQLGIGERVFFLGWELNTARIFSDLDLTCLSSVNEGLPLALLESIAAGVPIVSTRVGGTGDLVQEGIHGELVAPGDSEGFADALLRAAGRRARIEQHSSCEIRSRYSVQSLIRCVTDVYEEALSDHGQHNSIAGSLVEQG